ncbi:hypothetical protein PESHB5_01910 [Pediococcus parvulus]
MDYLKDKSQKNYPQDYRKFKNFQELLGQDKIEYRFFYDFINYSQHENSIPLILNDQLDSHQKNN